MQNKGNYARRWKSFKVTDFDFPLVNDIRLTYLLSSTVSEIRLIIGQIFASDRGSLHFNALAGGDSCE